MKITESLLNVKKTFLPVYGRNGTKKIGRRLLKEEEVIVFDKIPLVTKNYIEKKVKQDEIRCIEQVADLINCLVTNEYNSSSCTKEYQRAINCRNKQLEQDKERKLIAKKNILPELPSSLSFKQTNLLLKNFKIPGKTKED